MNVINFAHRDGDSHADLESAFNDDFDSAANSVRAALLRWMVIVWAVATMGVGTFVIARSLLEYAPEIFTSLGQIFS